MEKACKAQFSTKTLKKKKMIVQKKIIEDLADVATANDVNNDTDLSVNSLNNDIQRITDFSNA